VATSLFGFPLAAAVVGCVILDVARLLAA